MLLKQKRKRKDMFNKAIDVLVTIILSTIVMYVWFFLGTNLSISVRKFLKPIFLPHDIKRAPYCCKGMKKTSYGFPYNLDENPTVFPFIPYKVKHLSTEWMRSFFYIKHWLAGTFKHSWSGWRRLLSKTANYVPTKQSEHNYMMELAYFILSPVAAILFLGISFLLSILFTIYGSFKTNLFWSIVGFLFVLLIAIGTGISQLLWLSWIVLFKGISKCSLKETTRNFFKYGRGPFILGSLLLIMSKFAEIPILFKVFSIITTSILLYVL